jgi:hypothetical protein
MDAFYKALEEDKTFLEIHDKQYDFWHLIVDEITEIPYDGNDHNDSIIGKSP